MNIIYALFAFPAGKLADRLSHPKLLGLGILMLVLADLVLAQATNLVWGGAGLMLWGLHMAMTQGLMATIIASHAPPDLRGTAFGLFNLASGVAMLIGNVLAGGLWDMVGPSATFLASGLTAAIGILALPLLRRAP